MLDGWRHGGDGKGVRPPQHGSTAVDRRRSWVFRFWFHSGWRNPFQSTLFWRISDALPASMEATMCHEATVGLAFDGTHRRRPKKPWPATVGSYFRRRWDHGRRNGHSPLGWRCPASRSVVTDQMIAACGGGISPGPVVVAMDRVDPRRRPNKPLGFAKLSVVMTEMPLGQKHNFFLNFLQEKLPYCPSI